MLRPGSSCPLPGSSCPPAWGLSAGLGPARRPGVCPLAWGLSAGLGSVRWLGVCPLAWGLSAGLGSVRWLGVCPLAWGLPAGLEAAARRWPASVRWGWAVDRAEGGGVALSPPSTRLGWWLVGRELPWFLPLSCRGCGRTSNRNNMSRWSRWSRAVRDLCQDRRRIAAHWWAVSLQRSCQMIFSVMNEGRFRPGSCLTNPICPCGTFSRAVPGAPAPAGRWSARPGRTPPPTGVLPRHRREFCPATDGSSAPPHRPHLSAATRAGDGKRLVSRSPVWPRGWGSR
jgi:hypothetical protein